MSIESGPNAVRPPSSTKIRARCNRVRTAATSELMTARAGSGLKAIPTY